MGHFFEINKTALRPRADYPWLFFSIRLSSKPDFIDKSLQITGKYPMFSVQSGKHTYMSAAAYIAPGAGKLARCTSQVYKLLNGSKEFYLTAKT